MGAGFGRRPAHKYYGGGAGGFVPANVPRRTVVRSEMFLGNLLQGIRLKLTPGS